MNYHLKRILWVLAAVLVVYGGFIAKNELLTTAHGDEFRDRGLFGEGYLSAFGESFDCKVLSYGGDRAKVYYFSEIGGELAIMERTEDGWVHATTEKSWSRSGSADDYLIFPYLKEPLF